MKINGKEEAFICGILISVGIGFLFADMFSAKDFAWRAYALLTGGCTLSLYLVLQLRAKWKKILCIAAVLVSQSLIIAGFLTGLSAVKISVVVCLIFTVAVFVLFLSKIPSKKICSSKELQSYAQRNSVIKYNFFSNAVCVCGIFAMVYNDHRKFFLYILICAMMISVTLARQFYSKKYFTKKPIAYVSELLFILVGFFAETFVAWIIEIPESGLGFTFIYIVLLLTAYAIFDRPYVVKIVEEEFNNRNIK